MLPPRTETILKSIVGRYIVNAAPVPSQSILNDYGLGVSSATIRNEMARLERDGYILRPHTSAGSIPSDMGYRYYVESLGDIELPLNQQHQVEHMFHQVETKLEEWLRLTATLLSYLANNMAVVFIPRPANCQFKHIEMVSLQDNTAVLILVLQGAKVRPQLVTFEQTIRQGSTVYTDKGFSISRGLLVKILGHHLFAHTAFPTNHRVQASVSNMVDNLPDFNNVFAYSDSFPPTTPKSWP